MFPCTRRPSALAFLTLLAACCEGSTAPTVSAAADQAGIAPDA
jgi:hypothetical protein